MRRMHALPADERAGSVRLLLVDQCVLEGFPVFQQLRRHLAGDTRVLTSATGDRILVDPARIRCGSKRQVAHTQQEQLALRQECLQKDSADISFGVVGNSLALGVADADYFAAESPGEIELPVE